MNRFADLSASSLISVLATQGVHLGLRGSELAVRASHGMDDSLKALLRGRKAELVAALAGAEVPATSTQRRLWWLSDAGANARYTVLAAYRLHGPLDVSLWQDAEGLVLARHAAFATRWRVQQGELHQRVDGVLPALEQGTLAEQEVPAMLDQFMATPFTVAADQVLRHGLFRMASGEHLYLLACHHAIVDGHSLGVLFDEIGEAYRTLAAGGQWHPPAAPRFLDYARAVVAAGPAAHVEALDYWEGQLAGLAEPPGWPAAPADLQADGMSSTLLPPALETAAAAFCRRHDVAPFALYYAACKLTLAKARGAYDFLVGSPVANRPSGMEAAVGCFTNAVALRARPDPAATFADFVRQVQRESVAALAHQDAPLDVLAARLQAAGHGGSADVFDTFFALQAGGAPRLDGVRAQALVLPVRHAKFALSLMVDQQDGGTTLHWEFDGARVGRAGAEAMHERLLHLLEQGLREPATVLSDLALEAQVPAQDDAGPAGDLVTRFRAVAATHAALPACRAGDSTWTYGRVDGVSDAWAAHMQERGVQPGDYVAVLADSGMLPAAVLLAILKCGAAYVPVGAAGNGEREAALRRQVGIGHCVGAAGSAWAGLPAICLDAASADGRPAPAGRDGASVAYVNFSSGTTGQPKAIACTDAGVLRLVTGQDFLRLDTTLVMLNAAPPDFDAFTLELWAPLLNGGCCVPTGTEVPTPALLRRLTASAGVNAAWLTSALFNTLVDLDPGCFAGLRELLVGGDRVSPQHVARAYAACPQLRIVNGYGPTENTTFTTCHPIARDWPASRPVPIGRPIRGTGAYVLDVDGRPAPAGVVGELVATGAGLAAGYLGQPELTARAFAMLDLGGMPRRTYRTGDQAYRDDDGILHFVGRRDGQVKVNGKRVELARIEQVLRSAPGVRDAAALVLQRGSAQQLVAFVAGGKADLDAHLAGALESYQRPHRVLALAAMPVTANGKLDRARLLALARDADEPATASRPLSEDESAVAAVWNEVLGRASSPPDAGFHELGGNSLLAMRMIALINERCGAGLRFSDLAAGATIEQLALRVARQRSAAVPAADEAVLAAPLSARQRLLWNQYRMMPDSSAYNVHANYALHGPLDADRLADAVRSVYRAHAALQVRFGDNGGEPLQQAVPDPDWALQSCAIDAAALDGWLAKEAGRVFDLERGPVFVARLLRLAPGHHVLQLNFPHIVMDGWSFNVVWDAVRSAYREPGLALRGSDLAGYAAGAAGTDAANDWWRAQLGPGVAPRLPVSDAPFPANAPFVQHSPLLPEELAALRGLAQAGQVTVFAAAFALHGLLMGQLLGQQRFVVSTPYANRDAAGAHAWVGYYAAMLPLVCEAPAGLDVAGLLRDTGARLAQGMAHAELDMAWLLEHAGVEGGREGNPLQRLVFAWQEGIGADADLGDATARRLATGQTRPKFPLMLAVEGTGDRFVLRWEFDPRLFATAQIDALDRGYRGLLAAAAAQPQLALERLPRVVETLAVPEAAVPLAQAAAAAGPVRAALAATWSRVLGRPVAPGDDAHFFRLGGNSLLCLRVQFELARDHGIEADIGMLLRYPELAVLAERLAARPAAVAPMTKAVYGEGPMPLSAEQNRLWFLHGLQPSSAYNVPVLFEVAGTLDTARMDAALAALVRRHIALRLAIRDVDGEPEQYPVDPAGFRLRVEQVAQADVAARLQRETAHVFDLCTQFPLRALALEVADGPGYLLLNIHHLFMDGQSLKALKNDLAALYEGQALPAPAFDFADVVAWQQTDAYRAAVERDTAYWRERLAGAPASSMLPPDQDVPDRHGVAVKYRVALPDGVLHAVGELCRAAGVSRFAFWLSTFGLALARVTQQSDVVVAMPAANRAHPAFHDVVGFMTNTLALRLSLDDSQPFAGYLAQVGATLAAGLGHQACPLDALGGQRADASLPPLSQVLFSAAEHAVVDAGAWTLRTRPLGNAAAKYPLSVNVAEVDGATIWSFEYDAARYSEHLIGRFAGAVLHAIDAALAQPQGAVGDLALVPPAPSVPLPAAAPLPVVQRIEAMALAQPAAIALWQQPGGMTYASLWSRVAAQASALQATGLARGARVGILMRRTDALPAMLLAVLASGAVYVPLDPKYPADRVRYILADAQPSMVVTDDPALAEQFGVTQPVLTLAQLEGRAAADGWRAHAAGPDDLAYIIYTSGSTGKPKGVAIRHESVAWLAHWAQQSYSREDLANVLAATSICFDLSVFEIFVTLALGGGLSFAENLLDLIDDPRLRHVTLLNTVPSLLEETLRHVTLPPGLRVVNLAGEALPRALVARINQAAPQATVWNLYGPSEDTTYSTAAQVAPGEAGPVTIGAPLCGTAAHVLDERGRVLPDGIPGELYLSGKGLAAGYFNQEALTAERFVRPVADGPRMYRTGDQVRRLANGELEYLGRLDHQCKLRGYRIELGEIERVLGGCAGVREAAVVVCGQGTPEARLCAFFTAVTAGIDANTLRAGLLAALPTYMVPADIVEIDAMPLTPSGKLDRTVLRERALVLGQTVLDAEEAALVRIAAEVLGLDLEDAQAACICRPDGSDGIGALVEAIDDVFGIRLAYGDVLAARTVAKLAQLVRACKAAAEADSMLI